MKTPSLPIALSTLVVSWYGSRFAIGGAPEQLEPIANILTNYDPTPARGVKEKLVAPEFANDPDPDTTPDLQVSHRGAWQVHKTHERFGYIVGDRADFDKAFELLRVARLPHSGNFRQLRKRRTLARQLARRDFDRIPKENFLLGQNDERNGFAASFEAAARSAAGPSVDGDDNGCWQQTAIGDGVARADAELLEKGAAHNAH